VWLLQTQRMQTNDENIGKLQPTPWGFWPTIGFSCVIGVVYVFVQVIVVAVFAVVAVLQTPNLDIDEFTDSLQTNGLLLATATCAAAPFTVGLIVLFAKGRKQITVKQYLCLHNTGWKEIFKWSLAVLVFVGCFDTLTFLIGRPVVPEFMTSAYTTAYFAPLLWFAFIIVAPLSEELFFRGFLFKGIENSRLGAVGAAIITSLGWSILHIQYDIYGIFALFAGGLLLAFARVRSNSLYPPIAMHILQNLIATVEVIIYLRIYSNAV
jgi:membrane protease YdiL (CAAX protease family)